MELMQASTQWASRPADQRFTSLTEMLHMAEHARAHSRARVVSSRTLELAQAPGSQNGLVIAGPNGGAAEVSNYAFGQLATLAGAPAGYLRTLPAALAADNVNYGLQVVRQAEDVGVLLYKNGGPAELRAATGPNYGRIWNADVIDALMNRFGDGVTGDFRVPGIFGQRVDITTQNTTLYASDRDMFVFLADEEHRIELPNRRDGKTGSLARGFFVWNSEVGDKTLGIATFLFDYACSNRIVWGANEFKQYTLRHTAKAPDRFVEEVAPALLQLANSSTHSITQALVQAQRSKVDKVAEFLANRKFTRAQVADIQAAHMVDEGRPIESLWDVATGITAYARSITYQDDRVAFERRAGEVLELVERVS